MDGCARPRPVHFFLPAIRRDWQLMPNVIAIAKGLNFFKFRICRLAHVAAYSVCICCMELGRPGISLQERYSATFRKGGQRARLRFATTRAQCRKVRGRLLSCGRRLAMLMASGAARRHSSFVRLSYPKLASMRSCAPHPPRGDISESG